MASKHSIIEEIRLIGGSDIEKELSQLSAEGKKLFTDLKKEADKLGDTSGAKAFFDRLKKNIASAQKDIVALGKSYKDAGKAINEFGRNIGLVAVGVAGAGAAVFKFTQHATELVDSTGKAAQSAGLAIDEYGKLQFVFEQGDVTADQFGTAMKQLNKNIFDAARGVGEGKDAFDALGITVKNTDGSLRSATDVVNDIADRFSKMPDGVTKSAAAVKIFGRAGALMIPALNDGRKAMAQLEQQAVDLGLVFDATSFKIAQEFNDSLNALKRGIGGISTQLGLEFAPAFTDVFKTLTQLLIDNKQRILDFGKTITSQIVPIIEDFSKLLSGKDSEVKNKGLIQLRDTVVSIGTALGTVAALFNALFNGLVDLVQPFVDIINEMFGTNISAQAVVFEGIIFGITGGFKALGATLKAVQLSWGLLVKLFGSGARSVALAITFTLGVIAELQIALENARILFAEIGKEAGEAFTAAGNTIAAVWNGILDGIKNAVDAGVALFVDFQKRGLGVFGDLVNGVVGLFDDLGKQVMAILDGIVAAIKAAITSALRLGGLLGGGGDNGSNTSPSGGGGFKAGGRVRGPGTSTSDSIVARLSDGEYVIRARAVRAYGAGLLHAINSLSFKPPRFAVGGPVSAGMSFLGPMPALAASGPTGRPFSLTIGSETFDGLLAPETVASKMVRFAQTKSVRSAGRKPSWR